MRSERSQPSRYSGKSVVRSGDPDVAVGGFQAEDVANALLFLASDEARYITGLAFPVGAGMSVK